jgi:hypothetical protein
MSEETAEPHDAPESPPHELRLFMEESARQMAAEYARITARSREDPGTAGDEGEENWAELLRDWLPSTYHVKTKGRILSEVGLSSSQVDVLVLSPAYPPALLNRKQYLASGVIAAFECKLTLRPHHILEVVKNAASIRRNLFVRTGTPFRDLFSPLIYGLLAHSHTWTAPAGLTPRVRSDPCESFSRPGLWARKELHDEATQAHAGADHPQAARGRADAR